MRLKTCTDLPLTLVHPASSISVAPGRLCPIPFPSIDIVWLLCDDIAGITHSAVDTGSDNPYFVWQQRRQRRVRSWGRAARDDQLPPQTNTVSVRPGFSEER